MQNWAAAATAVSANKVQRTRPTFEPIDPAGTKISSLLRKSSSRSKMSSVCSSSKPQQAFHYQHRRMLERVDRDASQTELSLAFPPVLTTGYYSQSLSQSVASRLSPSGHIRRSTPPPAALTPQDEGVVIRTEMSFALGHKIVRSSGRHGGPTATKQSTDGSEATVSARGGTHGGRHRVVSAQSCNPRHSWTHWSRYERVESVGQEPVLSQPHASS